MSTDHIAEDVEYELAQTFHRSLTTEDRSLMRAIMSDDVTWVLLVSRDNMALARHTTASQS